MKYFVILAHGMNLAPEKMGDFESLFKEWGAETYNITFRGHRPGMRSEYDSATAEHWLEDFDKAFKYYQDNYPELPLFFIGYSLGALVGLSYLQGNIDFKKKLMKMILIAPAIAPRSLLVLIAKTVGYPRLTVPSLNLKNYNVHKWSSIRVNNEIYKLIKNLSPPLESKALVVLNQKDELISYKKTKSFIEKKSLRNWRVFDLKPERKWYKPVPQHLIIDEKTIGKKTWDHLKNTMYLFIHE